MFRRAASITFALIMAGLPCRGVGSEGGSPEVLPGAADAGLPVGRDASAPTPRTTAESFCEAVLAGDADAAAVCLATPEPMWTTMDEFQAFIEANKTTMDEFQAFIEANNLAFLGRPWRVSGEAAVGEERCRLWLTTDDDEPPHTFSLILLRDADSDWRIREVDGYDVAEARPAEPTFAPVPRVRLGVGERGELVAAFEAALSDNDYPAAFDAGFRLWEGGVLSYDAMVAVLHRWRTAARNGESGLEGFEERATRLYEAVRDDSTPVRWRMYPDRAYLFPLNVKAGYDHHRRMAALAKERGDTEAMALHQKKSLDALLQAYGYAKDRASRVYLLQAALPAYRSVARASDDTLSRKERRLYQTTLLQNARTILPRSRAKAGVNRTQRGAGRATENLPRSEIYARLRQTYEQLRLQSARRSAKRESAR
jgi:hypothetical protein